MGLIFTIILGLAVILLLQSLFALVGSIGFARYARRQSANRQREYQPKAVILVPCKGLDPEFEENLRPLFSQNYGEYEVIFITESETDPAHEVIERMIEQSPRPAWLLMAGESKSRGQKIHNLCAGIEMLNTIDRRTEVLVFADADARPGPDWLAELVAPLGDKRIGATTGFRWFVPVGSSGGRGSAWNLRPSLVLPSRILPSLILAVWNAGALALLGERSRFAWGGSMAIRRENFERLRVLRRWDGAVSDDYMLTGAVHEARQRIKFIPAALVRSPLAIGWRGLFEFTTRQIRITRVYSPIVWKLGLATHLFYNLTFWGILAWMGLRGGQPTLALLASGIYLLGAVSGALRATVADRLVNPDGGRNIGLIVAHTVLNPLVSLLYLGNFLASLASRQIVWRGITYEMVSPDRTIRRR
jgi:ceramide glucosyltransferase